MRSAPSQTRHLVEGIGGQTDGHLNGHHEPLGLQFRLLSFQFRPGLGPEPSFHPHHELDADHLRQDHLGAPQGLKFSGAGTISSQAGERSMANTMVWNMDLPLFILEPLARIPGE